MNTHKQSKLGRSILLALAIAVVCIPVAQARNTALRSATADPSFTDSYIGHPGGPGAAGPVLSRISAGQPVDGRGTAGAALTDRSFTDSYIGHPGGPGAVGLVLPAISAGPPVEARSTAGTALTDRFTDSYIGHPGGPGSVDPVFALPSSGSYIGHAGGPGSAGQVPVIAPAVGKGSSFDWGAAGIGAGFVVGLGLLAAGVRLMVRGRSLVAQPHV